MIRTLVNPHCNELEFPACDLNSGLEFDKLGDSACDLNNRVEFSECDLDNGLECGLNNLGGSASDLTNNGLE